MDKKLCSPEEGRRGHRFKHHHLPSLSIFSLMPIGAFGMNTSIDTDTLYLHNPGILAEENIIFEKRSIASISSSFTFLLQSFNKTIFIKSSVPHYLEEWAAQVLDLLSFEMSLLMPMSLATKLIKPHCNCGICNLHLITLYLK